MRLFEVAILLALLACVLGAFSRRGLPQAWRFLPWLGATLIGLHLLLEGYRWQMVPAYVLTFFFLLASLRSRQIAETSQREASASRWRKVGRYSGAVLVLLVYLFAAALPALFPVFDLPTPTGPYAIGTTNISLLDSSRPESFTADESDRRDLPMQVWYPAAAPDANAKPEKLASEQSPVSAFLTLVLGASKLSFVFDHLALVETHSYRNAALSDALPAFPVLVFSHGYWGSPNQNTAQMEQLASHGYVVFSIGHPYEAMKLSYPDGRIVRATPEFIQSVNASTRKPGYGAHLWKLIGSKDPDERARELQANNAADEHFSSSIEIWSADTRFLFDELWKADSVPALSRFAGRLDLARLGVFGMSFGGGTATEVCIRDSRCRAGVNMDGTTFGEATSLDSAMKVPFMFMTAEPFEMLQDPVYRRSQAPAWLLTVDGSLHVSYTDMVMFSPVLRWLGITGTINPTRMESIMNSYLLAFFDQSLRDKPSRLLQGSSPDFPEVRLRSRTPALTKTDDESPASAATP